MRKLLAVSCLGIVLLPGCTGCEELPPVADPSRNAYVAVDDPLGEPVKKVVYLDQNWSPSESLRFYSTPQGSQLLPYQWFLHLEQADSTALFRDNRNILKYRYLPRNAGPTNPDGLPVGFVEEAGVGRRWLGFSLRGVPYQRDPPGRRRLSSRRGSDPGRRPGVPLGHRGCPAKNAGRPREVRQVRRESPREQRLEGPGRPEGRPHEGDPGPGGLQPPQLHRI